MKQPKPKEIAKARKDAGLKQREAAELVSAALRSWQCWEYGERKMPAHAWELFKIKTGQSIETS